MEDKARVELTGVIRTWLESGSCDLPYIGENTAALMATAAVAVLAGIADAHEWLEAQGMLKEDE